IIPAPPTTPPTNRRASTTNASSTMGGSSPSTRFSTSRRRCAKNWPPLGLMRMCAQPTITSSTPAAHGQRIRADSFRLRRQNPMDLLIATSNPGKVREYRTLLADVPANLLGLNDVGLGDMDVEESG